MKKYNNLFTAGHAAPWKYPKNWIYNITRHFNKVKFIFQRAVKGYSSWDLMDFDSFLIFVLIDGLRELANTAHGYPGNDEFPTHESWTSALRHNAQLLENSMEETSPYQNKYEDNPYNERGELSQEFIDEERHISNLRKADKQEALFWIAEHFDYLWD